MDHPKKWTSCTTAVQETAPVWQTTCYCENNRKSLPKWPFPSFKTQYIHTFAKVIFKTRNRNLPVIHWKIVLTCQPYKLQSTMGSNVFWRSIPIFVYILRFSNKIFIWFSYAIRRSYDSFYKNIGAHTKILLLQKVFKSMVQNRQDTYL